MNSYLKSYIENNIIREYSSDSDNYEISAYENLSNHEQNNLVDLLFQHDSITRDFLFDRMQQLIDQRSILIQSECKYEMGFVPNHDSQTGEVIWRKSA